VFTQPTGIVRIMPGRAVRSACSSASMFGRSVALIGSQSTSMPS
jgi:hypothetical protein